jgi:hypothetical protein
MYIDEKKIKICKCNKNVSVISVMSRLRYKEDETIWCNDLNDLNKIRVTLKKRKKKRMCNFYAVYNTFRLKVTLTNGAARGRVIKVIDFNSLALHHCWFQTWQGLWIVSCGQATTQTNGASFTEWLRSLTSNHLPLTNVGSN